MSPAILTETLWALAHRPQPIIPTRVVAITTAEGRQRLATLFRPTPSLEDQSPWDALRSSLTRLGHDLTGRLRFGMTGEDVSVITDIDPNSGASRELADIRSEADHRAAADTILERIRSLASNPDVQLVGSIAGGRKTMGALLYAAFTLAARETDQLTHVLITEPFETLPGFWFPKQPGGPLTARDGSRHLPDTATIELADLSFVPLRNLFQRELGRGVGSFGRLVDACRSEVRQRAAEQIRLTIDQSIVRMELNQTILRTSPREHLVLLFFATRAKQGSPPFTALKDATSPLNQFQQSLTANVRPGQLADWRLASPVTQPMTDEDVRRALSDLRRRFMASPPHGTALATCLPARGHFGLNLQGPQIHLR
jgi:CRISPR-associated protein (TIGR02584 family)